MFARLALLPVILLLAACAEEPSAPQVESPTPEAVSPEAPGPETETAKPQTATSAALPGGYWPGGYWNITEVFGMAPSSGGGAGLVGRRLRLDADQATDALGLSCASPVYTAVQQGEAEFLGAPQSNPSQPPARMATVIEVTCDGAPFARFATWRDGTLLTRAGGAILHIERAAPSPPRPVVAAAVVPKVAVAPPPLPTGEILIYLASYRGPAAAERGWRELAARSALLRSLKRETKVITLPRKGRFIRLFAKASDPATSGRLCTELKRQLPDCGINWR
jgi:hypothetical protein